MELTYWQQYDNQYPVWHQRLELHLGWLGLQFSRMMGFKKMEVKHFLLPDEESTATPKKPERQSVKQIKHNLSLVFGVNLFKKNKKGSDK